MSSRGGVAGIGGPIAVAAWCGTAGAKRGGCRSSAAVAASDVRQLVAESARRSIRASDVVARLGGDTFALLLPEAGPDAADAVIRKLQGSVRDESRETALPLSVSGGVVTCLQPAESLEAVIGAADRLLSGAKGAGNDTFWCEVIAPLPL